MNRRFKPALHGVSATNLAEYEVALGDELKALLVTAMLVDLDIHMAGDSNRSIYQDRNADIPDRVRKNNE
jgi:hypothetical protein